MVGKFGFWGGCATYRGGGGGNFGAEMRKTGFLDCGFLSTADMNEIYVLLLGNFGICW